MYACDAPSTLACFAAPYGCESPEPQLKPQPIYEIFCLFCPFCAHVQRNNI